MPESPDDRAPRAAGGTTVADEPRPPAPPPPAAKRARPKRTRPANPDDQRYPRPAWFQVVRWVFRLWYLSVVAYPVTVVQNLQKLVGSGGQVTPDSLARASLLKALVDLWTRSPWIFGVAVAAVLALTLAGRLAHADQEYEKAVLAERERRARQAEDREGLVAAAPEIVGPLVPPLVEGALKDLGVTPGAGDAAPAGPPFEQGLLPPPAHFVGRAHELQSVLDRLTQRGTAAITGTTALGGQPGIGKSALAAQAIALLRAQGRFPDGVAVVIAQHQHDALVLLRLVLARFDPGDRLRLDQRDAAGLATAAHTLLDGKDALIVLDNLEPDVAAPVLLGPLAATGVAVLLTARQVVPGLPPEATLRLDLLPPEEALDLFAVYYRGQPADALDPADRATARRIVEELGRHTLAVRQAGAYAATTHRPLDTVADELANPRRALTLRVPDAPEAVLTVFTTSYEALGPDAQRLFPALAAFSPPELRPEVVTELRLTLAPEFGRRAVVALAKGLGLADPEGAADLLVARALADLSTTSSLPAASDRERLRLHPLMRDFAVALFTTAPPEGAWSEAERDGAQRAIARHYGDYANATPDLALAPDEANIAGALEWAHAHGRDELVADICNGMQYFWRNTGRTAASLRYLPWGVAAAERLLGERPADGADAAAVTAWNQRADTLFWLLLNAGYAYQATGRYGEAVPRYERCLGLARQAGLRRDEGAALSVLGQVAARRGRLDEAAAYYQQSLAIRREVGDRPGEGVDLSSLGQVAAARGRLDEAAAYYQQALAIDREVGDRPGEGAVLSNLGQVAAARGRLDEAAAYYQQSLAIRREVGDRPGEGVDLGSLGQVAAARGRLDEAEAYYRQSLSLLRDVQDAPDEATVSLILGALLIEQRNNRDEGCPLILRAVAIRHELELPGEDEARATARRLGCV